MNTGLIGQPTAWSQNVAAVGPTVEAGLAAVADSANGLGQGNGYESLLDISRWHPDNDQLVDAKPAPVNPLASPATGLTIAEASPRFDAGTESTAPTNAPWPRLNG